ncbi:MAG: 3-phosphoshikimate 1-carboxyvinyltransferase, partial [Proteobacteria bacterium]|nr:3-phosphoshikimate 1-carboxyvinyltransferase [Pseudomonadota bacterium]
PRPIRGDREIRFNTYSDHRIAMSTSIFGLAGITVIHDDANCVSKSFPTFFDEWAKVREGNQ